MGPIFTEAFEKHLKKTTIVTNVVTVFIATITSLSVIYGFYYKTDDKLQEHTIDIQEMKLDVGEMSKQVHSSEIMQNVNQTEIKDIKANLQRVEEKQDKTLELMIDLKRLYNKHE